MEKLSRRKKRFERSYLYSCFNDRAYSPYGMGIYLGGRQRFAFLPYPGASDNRYFGSDDRQHAKNGIYPFAAP